MTTSEAAKAADRMRALLSTRGAPPATFREALRAVPADERDGWVDRVLGLDEVPDDGPELPRGGVPYLPCSVETLLKTMELADVREGDVFVDVGSGLGRATALMHLLTGAEAIGVEIQPALVNAARALAERLKTPRVTVVEGDAAELTGRITTGSVFFLYCPFSGERLARVLDDLELIARTRQIRVCSVGLPLPPLRWLSPVAQSDDLAVFKSAW